MQAPNRYISDTISLASPASYPLLGLLRSWEGKSRGDNGFQITAGTRNPSTPQVASTSGDQPGPQPESEQPVRRRG